MPEIEEKNLKLYQRQCQYTLGIVSTNGEVNVLYVMQYVRSNAF